MVTEYNSIGSNYTIETLQKCRISNEPISGVVKKYIPNTALVVDLGNGIDGILSLDKFDDSDNVSISAVVSKVGSNICSFIDNIDIENNKVILNRKKLHSWYKTNVLDNMERGRIFDTEILSIAPFGLFVDMGYGVIGLLPLNDISIARLPKLNNLFKVGDKLKVVYKGKNQGGYIVTHKELLGTWEENVKNFVDGEVVLGIIRDIKPYGAFIEITPNLTGLADIMEDSGYEIGQSITVLFKSYNVEKQKVKLHIVKVSDVEYKPNYIYRLNSGIIKEWVYTPEGSKKEIKTIFDF